MPASCAEEEIKNLHEGWHYAVVDGEGKPTDHLSFLLTARSEIALEPKWRKPLSLAESIYLSSAKLQQSGAQRSLGGGWASAMHFYFYPVLYSLSSQVSTVPNQGAQMLGC
eukprot:2695921-Amphidinium_carterae.1